MVVGVHSGKFDAEHDTSSPWDLALTAHGRLLIAMAGSHQIWALDGDAIGPLAGAGPERIDDGPFPRATFAQPFGLAVAGGSVYVADSESSAIRRLDLAAQTVETLVGQGLFEWGDVDGAGPEVRLQHPGGVTWYDGALWIADTYNHKVKRLDPATRRVQTLAAAGGLHEPGGLAGHAGRLYVADSGNHAVQVLDLAAGRGAALALQL